MELAQAVGYSEFHFIRLFREVTGLTPADYIRKRRLSEIAREIISSKRPISDIAFEYGFNSKENFTRAFKAEHHVLPTQYKATGNSLKLYDRLHLQKNIYHITPKISTIPSLTLIGYSSDEKYIPNFWNKYNCQKLSKRLSGENVCADYGVSLWNSNTNGIEYFIGVQAEDANGDLTGTKELFISGGLYAIFTTPVTSQFNFVSTVHRVWSYILNDWIPKSNYHCTTKHGHQFETYVEASRAFSEDIYIPIELK